MADKRPQASENFQTQDFAPLGASRFGMESLWASPLRAQLDTVQFASSISDKNISASTPFNTATDNESRFQAPLEDDEYADEDMITIQWWIGVLELVVFLIGTPANMVVLYLALFKKRNTGIQPGRKRNITTHLIMSMTSADLLFCLIHGPMMFLSYSMAIDFSTIPCLTLFGVTHISTVASSLSLLLINIDKFLHIRQPLHYGVYVTTHRGTFGILVCWMIAACWSLLFIFSPFTVYNDRCDVRLTDKGVYIGFAVGFFIIPTLISMMISAYVAVVVFHARMGMKHLQGTGRADFPLQMDLHSGYSSLYSRSFIHRKASPTATKKSTLNSNICTNGYLCPSPQPNRKSNSATTASDTGESEGTKSSAVRSSSFHCDYTGCSRRSPEIKRCPKSHVRRISFVFTTTIWSAFTVLPYRLVFIVWHVATVNVPLEQLVAINRITQRINFCLFALMALNAAGNPFITIITQRQYSVRLAGLWGRAWRKQALVTCVRKSPTAVPTQVQDFDKKRNQHSL